MHKAFLLVLVQPSSPQKAGLAGKHVLGESSSVREATREGRRLEFIEKFKLSRAEPVQFLSVLCGCRAPHTPC